MDRLSITGNGPLKGTVNIGGAKNAALPCLAAAILTADPVELSNLPRVRDIGTMCRLMEEMGLRVTQDDHRASLQAQALQSHIAPYDLVKTMRASILVLGPLLARFGDARVSLPGGCAIGARPVNLHLDALEKMGAEIKIDHGYVDAHVRKLKGCDIYFEKITVTGTENIMMAATLAEGTTVIHNAAREPEVIDLANMLRGMGALIQGDGTATITIQGQPRLHGTTHRVIPDRIEAGTYLCAGAITRGHVILADCIPEHLGSVLEALERTGLPLRCGNDFIEVLPHRGLKARDMETRPYPGFATDMQAQYMALMTQAQGPAVITETIFENRFMHVQELNRMDAHIRIKGKTAVTTGPTPLSGAEVMATDLRASASLVVAALVADGETIINRIYHLDRGYELIERKLEGLGALVQRLA